METSAGAASTVFLRLAPAGIGHQEIPIVGQKSRPQFVLRALVDVLGVVRDDALGDGAADGVDLRRHTPPLDAYAYVEVRELVLSEDEDRLERLESQAFRFDVLDGLAVHLDEAATLLREGAGGGGLLPAGRGRGGREVHDVRLGLPRNADEPRTSQSTQASS